MSSPEIRITPRARRAARESGLDWSSLRGTGRGGRIRERDIHSALAQAAPQIQGRLEPITPFRHTIAERMLAAIHQAAPVTLTTRADATRLVALRESLSPQTNPLPTYTDLFLKLAAHALRQHPHMTAQWTAQGLLFPDAIDIAFAVQASQGLMAPVVRDVPALSLPTLAGQTRQLAEQARQGRLEAAQCQGGVFTITNLGAQGIDAFNPILNLPQSAILGVGRIALEPAVVDGLVVPQWQTTLSLTFDHRVHDGQPAARFLAELRALVTTPDVVLHS